MTDAELNEAFLKEFKKTRKKLHRHIWGPPSAYPSTAFHRRCECGAVYFRDISGERVYG